MALLGLLEAELRSLPKTMSDLPADDDWHGLSSYLHALKGAACSIGATGLASAAVTLEAAIKKGDRMILEVAAFEAVAKDTARAAAEYRAAHSDRQS